MAFKSLTNTSLYQMIAHLSQSLTSPHAQITDEIQQKCAKLLAGILLYGSIFAIIVLVLVVLADPNDMFHN